MRMFSQGPSEQELVAEAERRRRSPVSGRFAFRLPGGSDPAEVSKHLSVSTARARGGYMAGQFHQPTADLIDTLQGIADAAATPEPAVDVRLDQWGAQRVHKVLLASRDRADDGDVRNAVDAVLAQWDRFSGWRPEAEAIEAARPPRIAAGDGGWLPVSA